VWYSRENGEEEATELRIAVPVTGEAVSATLDGCAAVRFYEDDHGRVTRRSTEPVEPGAARALIERRGVDALLCRALPEAERVELAMSGLLLAEASADTADDALRAYLGAAIACDPTNDCNYCGHKGECAMPRDA
jgi:acetyl-CoA acetyltransferase